MLRDLIDFVRSPYSWYLAPMGYVRETRMIAARARALDGAWRGHIEASRRLIEISIKRCSTRKTALVLGSGTLLDVPLDTLSRAFERVVLLDILHSRRTRKAVQLCPNITLASADVTGIAHLVFRAARRRDVRELPKSVPPMLSAEVFNFVVSVNMLSQLAVIPCDFLKGHCPTIPREQLSAFSRNLIETHLQWIADIAESTCLITDVRRTERLTNGKVIVRDILEGVELPEPKETWDWRIAPQGSVYSDRDVIHRVHAYPSFQPAGRGRRPTTHRRVLPPTKTPQ